MSPSVDTYVVVSLAFAVFAAVSAVGSAIVLGIGYERLRYGLERVREGLDIIGRQTGFFSTALHRLEGRVDSLEAPPPVVTVEKSKPAKKTKGKARSKKSSVQVAEVATPQAQKPGGINISLPQMSPSNDWQSYAALSREEALASFARDTGTDGKIRFM
jgi:hypothetical protein